MAETIKKPRAKKALPAVVPAEVRGSMDTLVDALKRLGAISIVQDVTVPGCEHFPDRLTIYFQITNDPAWKTYRLRILKSIAALPNQVKVFIGQQFMFTDRFTAGKKQQMQVNLIEAEGTELTINALVKAISEAKKGAIDARLPETQVAVGGVKGRITDVKSAQFTPSMTVGPGRGNAG